MKEFITSFLLLLYGTMYYQTDEKLHFNTNYTAIVNTICEETSIPDSCAGQEVYLVLNFKKRKVYITEKMISTCGEVYVRKELKYKWKFSGDNEIIIFSNPEEVKFTSLENLKLYFKDKVVFGEKNSDIYYFSNDQKN